MPGPGRSSPLAYSYFRGFMAPEDLRKTERFLVAYDEKANEFVMADKATVVPGRLTRTIFARPPTWALDLCHEYANCPRGAGCWKLHLSKSPEPIAVHDDDMVLVCLKSGTNTHLRPSDMEETAGLRFYSTLKKEGLIKEGYPWVCQRHLRGACPSGRKCLSLHVAPEKVKDIVPPPVEASTTLMKALQPSLPTAPGLQTFIDTTLNMMGLRVIGDVSVLSNNVFDALMQRDIEHTATNRRFWLLLMQQRAIPRTMPLREALIRFPGIDLKTIDTVANLPWLLTINDLCSLRPKVLYSLPMRAQLLDACEKLRARFEDDREVYSQIHLTDMAPNAFFRRMATIVCEFREKHAHKSWRKQDDTRPIVTSAITYVDPNECKCYFDPANGGSIGTRSPSVGSRDLSGRRVSEKVPSFEHWCQCPRKHVLAVNYEMSTPSGSRCSEQNALGMIASQGLPTTCIREVFVHGTAHNSEDPNPLFPCGVCENMFRRVSKDVQKLHGSDVMVYMFDQQTNPRKLVALPISEISHREGSQFRRFLTEDVRDTNLTPNGTCYWEETPGNEKPPRFDHEIPPAPLGEPLC
jgi:hypothetical protein